MKAQDIRKSDSVRIQKSVKIPSCRLWASSRVSKIISLKKDAKMTTNAISDMLRQKESPARQSKKGGAKGSVAILKESFQLGCVSQDSYSEKVYST